MNTFKLCSGMTMLDGISVMRFKDYVIIYLNSRILIELRHQYKGRFVNPTTFFLCPHCKKRCIFLFILYSKNKFINDSKIFCCKCSQTKYKTAYHFSKKKRLLFRQMKLKKLLRSSSKNKRIRTLRLLDVEQKLQEKNKFFGGLDCLPFFFCLF